MKQRLRGGFALGAGTILALITLAAFAAVVARPATAMPPHNHTYNCHAVSDVTSVPSARQ